MKVYELFEIPKLAGMSLIAGKSGKDHEVQTVNMMDAPDIVHFLKPNVFLVTTAYHFKDDPKKLADLIRTMSDKGCAALGIKTKRFLQEVPKDALNLADQLAFPVIELPLDLALGEVVDLTLRAIVDKTAQELTIALEAHKRFTHVIMQGNGIRPLLHELSKMIRHPSECIDQHLNVIARNPGAGAVFSALETVLPVHFPAETLSSPLMFSAAAERQTYTLFPMHMNEKKIGFLAVHGELDKTDHLSALIIEQAMNVISFALMKEQAIKQHARSIRNDFFLHFLEGAFSSREEMIHRAAEFSLRNDQSYICVAGKIDGSCGHADLRQQEEIYEFIEDEVAKTDPKAHFFTKGDYCILLYEVQEYGSFSIEDLLRYIQEKVSAYFGHTISFGISNLSHSFLQVRNAYKEAADALKSGEISKKTGYIQTYLTKDVMALLRLIPRQDLENFYAFALQNFYHMKSDERESLLATLSVYLETNCQISETAKRLYVHRNTVVYRIEKCEELLGKSLKDPDTNLQLRIALRIRNMLEPIG
ncbi:PucR family transcriptional regulator [Weizmannia acidilactici]|uniref:PucR family transcriptional regulator n=1 Tax=Weizmannia acidilactici TaxID=2607726 RepID=UPI00124C25BE|nr:PucR family transcriptional regulator [Weizmannia acidilactici]GER67603.1 purine catabolism regulatory protein [Weizmannia acidilactici]GER73689.1 purine catabolism regulatory protein [Weizmannia acidilactici]